LLKTPKIKSPEKMGVEDGEETKAGRIMIHILLEKACDMTCYTGFVIYSQIRLGNTPPLSGIVSSTQEITLTPLSI